MKQLERQPELQQRPLRTPMGTVAIAALLATVSQLVAGCVTSSTPPPISPRRAEPVSVSPTVVVRGERSDVQPSDRECAEYHRQRKWERERQVRVLTLELELYRDELSRLERDRSDESRLEEARQEIYWRIGAMSLLLQDPFSERTDIAGF